MDLGDRLTDTMRPLTSKYIPASLHFLWQPLFMNKAISPSVWA